MHTKFLYRLFNWFVLQRHWYKKTYSVLQNVSVRKNFPNRSSFAHEWRSTIGTSLNSESYVYGWETSKEDKNKWEKIFDRYTSDRDFMPRKTKNLKNKDMKNNQLRNKIYESEQDRESRRMRGRGNWNWYVK